VTCLKIELPQKENTDRSCDLLNDVIAKKGNFDGLHNWGIFPKNPEKLNKFRSCDFPKKEILVACISNLNMLLGMKLH
jgi:hypothetical protein